MAKEIPTPYLWSYQPQVGQAAGASQDYSTRINWLSAGPQMINQVNQIRDLRNRILMTQKAITETPRPLMNPPSWPAELLPQEGQPPITFSLPRNELLEIAISNSGAQLAGGFRSCGLSGTGVQLNEFVPSASSLRPDGVFQLGGGSRSSFDTTQAFLTLQRASSQPRSGGR